MNSPYRTCLAILATCISCNAIAENVVDKTRYVLGVNAGSVDTSGDFGLRVNDNISESTLNISSETGYSVGWGIENSSARFMLEYYVTEADIESPSFNAGNATAVWETESMFYSGYWTPDIYWGIKGILGAGIGYSRHTLSNATPAKMKESDWAFKASAGIEYGVIRHLSIYALAEQLFHSSVGDYVADNGTPPVVSQRSFSGLEQSRLSFGINYRY